MSCGYYGYSIIHFALNNILSSSSSSASSTNASTDDGSADIDDFVASLERCAQTHDDSGLPLAVALVALKRFYHGSIPPHHIMRDPSPNRTKLKSLIMGSGTLQFSTRINTRYMLDTEADQLYNKLLHTANGAKQLVEIKYCSQQSSALALLQKAATLNYNQLDSLTIHFRNQIVPSSSTGSYLPSNIKLRHLAVYDCILFDLDDFIDTKSVGTLQSLCLDNVKLLKEKLYSHHFRSLTSLELSNVTLPQHSKAIVASDFISSALTGNDTLRHFTCSYLRDYDGSSFDFSFLSSFKSLTTLRLGGAIWFSDWGAFPELQEISLCSIGPVRDDHVAKKNIMQHNNSFSAPRLIKVTYESHCLQFITLLTPDATPHLRELSLSYMCGTRINIPSNTQLGTDDEHRHNNPFYYSISKLQHLESVSVGGHLSLYVLGLMNLTSPRLTSLCIDESNFVVLGKGYEVDINLLKQRLSILPNITSLCMRTLSRNKVFLDCFMTGAHRLSLLSKCIPSLTSITIHDSFLIGDNEDKHCVFGKEVRYEELISSLAASNQKLELLTLSGIVTPPLEAGMFLTQHERVLVPRIQAAISNAKNVNFVVVLKNSFRSCHWMYEGGTSTPLLQSGVTRQRENDEYNIK
jgi:hypothetical protein